MTPSGAAFGPIGLDVVAIGISDSFTLPGQDPDEIRDLATLGSLEGVEQHAELLEGAWPETASADDPIQLAVVAPAADALGLEVGEAVALASRVGDERVIDAVVSGIYRPTDPTERFWWGDASLTDGLVESEQYRNFGPFLVTPDELLGRVVDGTARLTWHASPHIGDLGVDNLDRLSARIERLPAVIPEALPGSFAAVDSGLPQILEEADQSLLVSRTGVLLLMAQLAVLAAYAIALTADLIVDHRRLDTAMMRSRGASPMQVGGLALAEALLVVLPAAAARAVAGRRSAAAVQRCRPPGRRRALRSIRGSGRMPISPPARRRSGVRRCSCCPPSSQHAHMPPSARAAPARRRGHSASAWASISR